MARNQVVRYVITADAQQATRELDQSGKAAEGVNKKLGALGKAAVAFLAVKALGAVKEFVGDSVRAYSDLSESLNAVNVTFGKNAEGIKRLGQESAQAIGVSNAEFNSHAVSLAAFVDQIAADTGDVVGTMDAITTRAGDFASVMNLEVGDALGKFRSGLAGESEPLRQFGIDVSAAAVETFALANGIGTAGEQLTESEKIQARYGLIMEQTAKTAGDFANTSDELANQTRITAAEMENHKAIVGESLQAYKEWGNYLSLTFGRVLATVATDIQNVTGAITDGARVLQNYQIQSGTTVSGIEGLDAAFLDLNSRVNDGISLNERLFDGVKGDLKDFKETLPEMVAELGLSTDELLDTMDAADGLAHSWGLNTEQTEAFKAALEEQLALALRETDKNFARSGGAARKWRESQEEASTLSIEAIERWKGQLERGAESHEEFKTDIVEQANEVVTGFHELVDENQISLEEWAANRAKAAQEFETWVENINALQAAGFDELVADAKEAGFESSRGMVQEAVDTLNGPEGFSKLNEIVGSAGEDIGALLAQGMALGIDKNAADLVEAARAAVRRAENAARNEARIESPSKLFAEEVGKPIAEGIAEGIEGGTGGIESAIRGGVRPPGQGGGHRAGGGAPSVNITIHAGMGTNSADLERAVKEALDQWIRRNGWPRNWGAA